MEFLKEYGIDDKTINGMIESYDPILIDVFLCDERNVRKVIEYFQTIGINVVDQLLLHRIEIFSIDIDKIKKSIEKFDLEELVKNINLDFNEINCL